jgi:predicted enzyme related to lactoylglutathione lyase
MARVIHFEVPVDDPERASKFYANAFDWDIGTWGRPESGYWVVETGPREEPGIDGALTRRASMWAPIHVGVSSIDDALRRVEEAGGTIVTPKSAVPGVGYAAYCLDTEGNAIGVFQADPAAR